MNKKLQTVFHSKTFYIIISFVIALGIWIIALNTSNPVIENTIEVAISYVNENDPAEKNLSMTSDLGVVMATIRVSGRQDTVNNLLASEISVNVDFADVNGTGVTYLKVQEPVCEKVGLKIEDYYPKEIEVSYDTKKEMYLSVKPKYTNDLLTEGYEYISVAVEPDSIPITGFASDIENLDYVVANLSDNIENGSIDSNKTISLIGRYITTGGQDVTANFSPEKVTVKIEVAKRVPITYSLVGEPGEDCYIPDHKISEASVLLQGSAEALAAISVVDLGEIDIEGISETADKTLNIENYIPDGVSVYGASKRTVSITVEKLVVKEIALDITDVSMPGRKDGEYIYNFEVVESEYAKGTEFYVHVKGKASDVENITVSSLSPTLDLTDIDVGNYKFKEIVFTLPDGVELVGEYLVDITVSTPEEPESPTPTLPAETSSATPAATSSANTATKNPNDSAVSSATANPSATHLVQSSEPEVSASAATDENHTGQPENNSASAEN